MNATAGRDPLVSVILPTYNRECFLGESIRSVLGQTYGNLELIVVDDGSTDGSADLVASIAPEARYVWQANRGVADARNRGLVEARGDLIAFLDSDDAWRTEKLAPRSLFSRRIRPWAWCTPPGASSTRAAAWSAARRSGCTPGG